MTLQEFIENELEKNTLIGHYMNMKIKDLQESPKILIDRESEQIKGFINGLYYTEYITEDTWNNLWEDIDKITIKRITELYK